MTYNVFGGTLNLAQSILSARRVRAQFSLLSLLLFSAVRENRTRGGRNKFGPIYRRDRALRRQLQMQRLHTEGGAVGPFLGDRMFTHDFASLSQDVDVKPTAAALASLTAQNPSLHKDREFMISRRQVWRDMHHGGGYSAGKDFTQMSFPLFSHQPGGDMVSPVTQRSIDDLAAAAAADTFSQHFPVEQDQSSRPTFFHRQQTYQPSGDGWQYQSAPAVSSYNSALPQTSVPVSAGFSPGFTQDVRSELPRKPPGGIAEMPERCHYSQPSDVSAQSPQYSSSNVAISQYRTGVTREQGMHAYHHRHRRHHPAYSHYHQQLQRSAQQQPQPQLSSSLPQCPDVKQVPAMYIS